jgi:hypothetical protein
VESIILRLIKLCDCANPYDSIEIQGANSSPFGERETSKVSPDIGSVWIGAKLRGGTWAGPAHPSHALCHVGLDFLACEARHAVL